MKFYVKALTTTGEKAIRQHLADTTRLDTIEKMKGKAIVKHKIVREDPLMIMLKPRKVVLLAAKITPGLHHFRLDYIAQMTKTLRENGAAPGDYKLWYEGKR